MKAIERIKELMVECELNQSQLAERSNIAFGTINRILNEKQPLHPNTLQKIADALDVSAFELSSEADSYSTLNNQVNGYLEFGGEIKRIRSFSELEAWIKRIKPTVSQLPQQAKRMIRINEKNSKILKSELSTKYDFNIIDLNKFESYDTTLFNCWSFKSSNDIREGIAIPLGNQCGGFPFTMRGYQFLTSESAYLCGQFSHDTAEHIRIQEELIKEPNGYLAKRKIKKGNASQIRDDWDSFNVEWMLYVIWNKCRRNADFQSILLSIPSDAIIIENSTTICGDTAMIWGSTNKELEDARDTIEKYIEFQNPYMKQKELDSLLAEERNKINCIGTFSNGRNCMGKILKLCQIALMEGNEPPINDTLLNEKKIYLFGKLLRF